MSNLLDRLARDKDRRGSKPRCHGITHGDPKQVAARLTKLIAPFGSVSPHDHWMPQGFEQTDEAQLHKATRLLADDCGQIKDWWFAIFRGGLQTGPSFDIASTCKVNGAKGTKPGLLLVEAKAHDEELIKEEAGKPLNKTPSLGEQMNHDRIGEVIRAANAPFTKATGFDWSLSRDSRYQMSNRFASACKLTELGYPVILVYLGFLNATEMAHRGNLFEAADKWETLVRSHCGPMFPPKVWNQGLTLHSQPFVPLICSLDWPLEPKVES